MNKDDQKEFIKKAFAMAKTMKQEQIVVATNEENQKMRKLIETMLKMLEEH
jgi:UDP-glucose 6-dehydrogenase